MGLNNAVAVYDCVFDTDKHEQAILAAIALWAHEDEPRICWHSLKSIADKTHYCRNGVIGIIKRLEELGHITKTKGGIDKSGKKRSNFYLFVKPPPRKSKKRGVDKSVHIPVDKSAADLASREEMVHRVEQDSAPGGLELVHPVDPKRNNIKEREKAGGVAVRSNSADKVWRGKEVPDWLPQQVLEKEAKLIGTGGVGGRTIPKEQKTPLMQAAAACGMRRFEADVTKEFIHIMLRRDLKACLEVIDRFDADRREDRLKDVSILPKELLTRLSMLPELPDSGNGASSVAG